MNKTTKKLILYQIDSFTKEKFKGNPAGVVINAEGLNDKQMQQIAAELNNSETAFLFPPEGDCDGVIRYFTPKTEVPTCGHATIAAMYAKALEENLDSCVLKIKTRIGILNFEIIKKDNDYQVIMTQGEFKISQTLDHHTTNKIISALGILQSDLDPKCPIQIASTGHSKVIIGITSKKTLNKLTPNFYELAELSKQIKCDGYFAFTFDSDNEDILTYGRMFAPAIGINEDPVTGNAYGPFGGYLVQNKIVKISEGFYEFNGNQGEALNRLGVINVKVKVDNQKPSLIQIMGDAVLVFRTEMVV